jgi:predicted glutamine amidotransferase
VCELLALNARLPTTVRLSLDELARRGGEVGPHRDGWGVGFMQEGDALLVREPEAASDSNFLAFVRKQEIRSSTVVAHIRKATQGPKLLRNTQPFTRELGGRAHVFAHNGMLTGIEADARFPTRRFRRIGDTDSEHAFCALLDQLAPLWERGQPALEDRLAVVATFASKLRTLGPANFLYADGDAVFAHGHRRRDDTGQIRPPGLHVLCRRCSAREDGLPVPGLSIEPEHEQDVALAASVPLTNEPWEALREGQIAVLRKGRLAQRVLVA